MIANSRRAFALSSVVVLALSSVLATACDSGDEEPARPPSIDAGDASVSDAGDVDAADARDASVDAADELVDASPEPITCTVNPCAVEIAAGAGSVCVRLQDGTVRCWGGNGAGELGRGPDAAGSANVPAPVVDLADATQISGSASAPGDTYCARRANGTAVCWGSNANGVLGRIDDEGIVTESSPTPAPVSGLGSVRAVYAGYFVSCALLAGNDVACWGANDAAQIPGQPSDPGSPLSPTTFSLGGVTEQLGVSDRGTVALTSAGLVSWGLRGELLGPQTGVLGREVSTEVASPSEIALSHVSAIASSKGRACAIANGRVFCWGAGPTAGSDSVYPTYVGVGGRIAHAQTIAVGPRSACATLSDGSAWCWGDNSRGQLGVGNTDLQPIPVRVQKLAGTPVRMVAMEATTCAILSSGAVQCWGQNDRGQLGTGAADALPHLEPQNVVLTP